MQGVVRREWFLWTLLRRWAPGSESGLPHAGPPGGTAEHPSRVRAWWPLQAVAVGVRSCFLPFGHLQGPCPSKGRSCYLAPEFHSLQPFCPHFTHRYGSRMLPYIVQHKQRPFATSIAAIHKSIAVCLGEQGSPNHLLCTVWSLSAQ